MTRRSQPKGESSWRQECGLGQRRSRKTVEAIGRCSGPGARVRWLIWESRVAVWDGEMRKDNLCSEHQTIGFDDRFQYILLLIWVDYWLWNLIWLDFSKHLFTINPSKVCSYTPAKKLIKCWSPKYLSLSLLWQVDYVVRRKYFLGSVCYFVRYWILTCLVLKWTPLKL